MEHFPELDPLSRIERVSVPPYLLTRIEAAVESYQTVPVKWLRVSFASFIILVCFNALLIRQHLSPTHPIHTSELAQDLGLTPVNQLYHD